MTTLVSYKMIPHGNPVIIKGISHGNPVIIKGISHGNPVLRQLGFHMETIVLDRLAGILHRILVIRQNKIQHELSTNLHQNLVIRRYGFHTETLLFHRGSILKLMSTGHEST